MSRKIEGKKKIDDDVNLAQRICKELKSGRKEAIVEIYDAHHRLFFNIIRKRLFESEIHTPEDVFQKFWEKLLDGDIFCNYKGSASLRSYLCSILYHHIVDTNREIERERRRFKQDVEIKEYHDNSQKTSEESIIEKEDESKRILQEKLIQETRLQLSEISPRDEFYIKMRLLEKLEYRDIAVLELGKGATEDGIQRKIDAIKKQFTRPGTGSMARFRVILERLMERENLCIKDILDE